VVCVCVCVWVCVCLCVCNIIWGNYTAVCYLKPLIAIVLSEMPITHQPCLCRVCHSGKKNVSADIYDLADDSKWHPAWGSENYQNYIRECWDNCFRNTVISNSGIKIPLRSYKFEFSSKTWLNNVHLNPLNEYLHLTNWLAFSIPYFMCFSKFPKGIWRECIENRHL
jgi:hypothetical protein